MSYFKTVNLNPTAAAVYRANEKRKEQERKERERAVGRRTGKSRLEHWAQLRRDYPAIESMAKNVQTPSAEHPTQRYKLNKLINVIRFAHAAIGVLIMNEMTPAEIREFYDRNINMTLLDLSCETGLTIPELKKILLKDES